VLRKSHWGRLKGRREKALQGNQCGDRRKQKPMRQSLRQDSSWARQVEQYGWLEGCLLEVELTGMTRGTGVEVREREESKTIPRLVVVGATYLYGPCLGERANRSV
jgi:hypothetical protein